MKAFTGIAVGILAVLGAVAAIGIYFKKKAEKELEYDDYDEIMDSEDDFDTFFDEDDEVIDNAETAKSDEEADDEDAVTIAEDDAE